MVKVSISLDKSDLEGFQHKPEDIIRGVIHDAAQDMTRFLIQYSPYQHGKLRGWFIESLTSMEASIKSPANYALYQDQGTSAHMIRPVKAKALAWDGHFSRGHMVSGIKGKHFVRKSFNLVKPRLGGYLKKYLET